jgi:uroporphyrinogen-III synthase
VDYHVITFSSSSSVFAYVLQLTKPYKQWENLAQVVSIAQRCSATQVPHFVPTPVTPVGLVGLSFLKVIIPDL